MSVARVIVCEKSGRWAAALGRALPGRCLLVETRSLAQCSAALEEETGFATVELTEANASAVIQWLQRTSRVPHLRLAALIEPDLAAAELLLREAGALDVLASVLDVPRLVRLALRQSATTPTNEPTIREWVAQRLPWSAVATPK